MPKIAAKLPSTVAATVPTGSVANTTPVGTSPAAARR